MVLALLCAAFAGVSACSTLPSSEATHSAFSAAFDAFLASAPAGSRAVLAASPWGPQASVYAHASYYAASGRICRELTIALDGIRRPGLACQLPHGGWESVRVLQPGGRPVFSSRIGQAQRQGTK